MVTTNGIWFEEIEWQEASSENEDVPKSVSPEIQSINNTFQKLSMLKV